MHRPPGENQGLDSFSTTLCCRNLLSDLTKLLASRAISNPNVDILIPKDQWMECIHGFPGQNSVSPTSCGFDDLYNERSACSRFSLSSITEQWYYKKALASCMNFSSSYDYGCSSCIEAIPDFRDYQLRISNVNANDKKTKILCGVAVLISVVAENLKNSAWIDDFYRCLPASDAFTIITLLLVFLLIKYVSKGKKKRPKPVTQSKEITTWSGLYRFSKAEIENAINHSKVRKSLGRGSAGEVYKGVLPSGQAVAIKHIHKSNSCDSFQG
uniref:Putative receptor-like protein kinase n=1 Tax=Populus alba TaxID=43335 RepID=A0A4U5LVG9_POPAL|nr:putative receptor-like protein kinase [Populus alba]